MPGACDRRATQRGGMHRRPGWRLYFCPGHKCARAWHRAIAGTRRRGGLQAAWRPLRRSRQTSHLGGTPMRQLTLLGVTVVLVLGQGTASPKAAGCDALGNVQFICGVISAEDLVVVPGSEWVIASGDAAGGAVTLINVRDKTTTALFPSAAAPKPRLDRKTYDSCPGPI